MFGSRALLACIAGACALLVACTDPDLPTDLRTDGPPDVTTVLVMSDLTSARLVETATFCRLDDEKRPGLVGLPNITTQQVCPDDLTKPALTDGTAAGAPPAWYVRVAFDELLDPSIEDLVPQLDSTGAPTGIIQGSLANTQPVELACDGAPVPYDGYYVPNGNRVSWPVGPALFVKPLDATSVATGAHCTVSVKAAVANKRGDHVPDDQRGPYAFEISPMALRFSIPDPTDGTTVDDPSAPIEFLFTAALAATGGAVDPADVRLFSGPNLDPGTGDGTPDPAVCGGGGTAVPTAEIATDLEGTGSLALRMILYTSTTGDDNAFVPKTTYRLEFAPTAHATAAQGGTAAIPDGYSLCFSTTASTL